MSIIVKTTLFKYILRNTTKTKEHLEENWRSELKRRLDAPNIKLPSHVCDVKEDKVMTNSYF